MLTAIVYGLGAAVGFGLSDVGTAIGSRRLGSLRFVALSQTLSLGLLVIGGLLLEGGVPIDSPVMPVAIALGILSGLSYLAFATALRLGPISVVSPVVSAYGGLTVVAAVVILGESLTPTQAFGAIVATSGILLVGVKFSGALRATRLVGPGVPFALASLIGFGFLAVGLAGPIASAGVYPVLIGLRAANTATAWAGVMAAGKLSRWLGDRAAASGQNRPIDFQGFPDHDHGSLFGRREMALGSALVTMTAVCDLLGTVSYAVGIRDAETWLVGLVSSFGPGVAVVVAVGLLHERLGAIQWTGLAVLLAGLALVSQR